MWVGHTAAGSKRVISLNVCLSAIQLFGPCGNGSGGGGVTSQSAEKGFTT